MEKIAKIFRNKEKYVTLMSNMSNYESEHYPMRNVWYQVYRGRNININYICLKLDDMILMTGKMIMSFEMKYFLFRQQFSLLDVDEEILQPKSWDDLTFVAKE